MKNIDICFVDDETLFLKILKAGLRDEIHSKMITPHFFTSGEEFIKYMAESEVPEILIVDIDMPHINGFDVLKQVLTKNPKTTVYVCSTYKRDDYREKAEYLGAKGYFEKPLRIDELKKEIYHHAGREDLIAQLSA